jgi:hypothetical protein
LISSWAFSSHFAQHMDTFRSVLCNTRRNKLSHSDNIVPQTFN